MTELVCENCGTRTDALRPCPCELFAECPIANGVCQRCWRFIAHNAAERRSKHLGAA